MEKLIQNSKKVLKKNLVSITRFGTEMEPNNVLIVTEGLSFDIIDSMRRAVRGYIKRNKVVPLMFTKQELLRGSDVFPLEFLDMKTPREVLYGQDVLAKVKFDRKAVRRHVEFELRSKLVHLRASCLHIRKDKELRQLLRAAVPSVMPLFYGLLYLKNKKIPDTLEALYAAVEKHYDVNLMLLRVIRKNLVEKKDLVDTTKDLMETLEVLINTVDRMKV